MVAIPIANISTPGGFPGSRQLNSARQAANTDAPLTFAQTVSQALGKPADTSQPVTVAKSNPAAKANSPLEPSATGGKAKPSAKDPSNDPEMAIPIGALSLLIALQNLPAVAPQSAKAAPSTQSGAMPVTINSSGASAAPPSKGVSVSESGAIPVGANSSGASAPPQSEAASLTELAAMPVSIAISAAFAAPKSTKAVSAMQAGAVQVGPGNEASSAAPHSDVSANGVASSAADSANISQIPQSPLPQIPSAPLPSGPTAGNNPGAEGVLPPNNNESENNPADAKAAQSSSTLQIKDAAARSANQPLGSLLEAALPSPPQLLQPARTDAIPGATSNSAAQPVVVPAPAQAAAGLGAAVNAAIAAPHNEPSAVTASSSSSAFHQAAFASQHVSVVQASSNSGLAGRQNSQDPSANQNQQNHTDVSDNFVPANQASSHDVQKLVSAMLATSVGNQAPSQPAIPTVAPSAPPAMITAPTAPPADRSSSTAPAQDAPAASSHTSGPTWQTDAAPGRMVSSAELLATSGHSEMRVAMDTDRLGSVELRAHMIGDQLGAAITVEKRDVHAALAAELPVLQQSLSDKHLRIDQVALLHGTTGGNNPDAGTPAKQDQPSARRAPVTPWSLSSAPVSSISRAEQNGIFDSYGRLSVHA